MKLTAICTTACLCLSSCFLAPTSNLEAFPKTKLAAPYLSDDLVLKTCVSMHDFRDKGIRVEPTYIREKLIIHNYGHGGATLPLSWGSVQEAFNYLEIEVLSDEFMFDFGSVAVLGCGVLGLTTANFLLDRGYQVHVYSEKFPPHITSDPFEGLWWPTAVSPGIGWQQKTAFKRILKNSYAHFKQLAEAQNPDYNGVTKQVLYSFESDRNHFNDATEEFFGDGTHVAVTFDSGVHKNGVCYDTFHIDPKVYIQSLYESALGKGAVFVQRSLKSKDELADLDENIIFNCIGKGSMDLFDDHDLSTVRHQTVSLLPQKGVDYMLRLHASDATNGMSIFSADGRIVIGGDYQFSNDNPKVDAAQTAHMLEAANAFFR